MEDLEIIIKYLMNGEIYFPEAFSIDNKSRIEGLNIIFKLSSLPKDLYIATSLFHNFLRIFQKDEITIETLANVCVFLAQKHLYQIKDFENQRLSEKSFKLILVLIKHIVKFERFTMLDYIDILGGDECFNAKEKNSSGHELYMNLMRHKTFAYLKPSEQFVAIYLALEKLEIDDISQYGFNLTSVFNAIDLIRKENLDNPIKGLRKFSLCKSKNSLIIKRFVSNKELHKETNFFNTFQIHERIGKGTFSEVYEVMKGDKIFCAKIMPLEEYMSFIKPIVAECVAMNKFKYFPGIVNIHEMFFLNQGGKNFCVFIMDMYGEVQSKSMKNLLMLKKFLRGIFLGISLIHKLGYVHGDCKKNNFVIDEEGNGIIIDFSLLLKNDQKYVNDIYTFGYRSPEICEYLPIHFSDDIWAIGVSILDILFPDYIKTVLFNLPLGKWWKDIPEKFLTKCDKREELEASTSVRTIMLGIVKNQEESLYELLQKIFSKRQERPTAEEILKMPFFN